MTRNLVLAVLVSGLALVLFAERIGIPAGLAAVLVLGLVGGAVLLIALLSGTSRLPVFLVGEGAETLLHLSIQHAILLGGAVLVLDGFAAAMPSHIMLLVGAYLVGLMLCPAHSIDPKWRSPVPAGLRGDEAGLLTMAIGLIAFVGVLCLGSNVLSGVGGALAQPILAMPALPLVLTAVLLLPGGNRTIVHLASMSLTLAILFMFLPFLLELLRDGAEWQKIALDPTERGEWLRSLPAFSLAPSAAPLPGVIGLALGVLAGALQAPVQSRAKRIVAPLLGVVVLCLIICVVLSTVMMLERMLTLSFAGVQPQLWPLFAFEDSLRGWLTVCGRSPVDALDVVQACRNASVGLPVSREAISLDPTLNAPAIAAARGLPMMLGVVWLAVGLVVFLSAQMLLLSSAARAFSEVILFRLAHPRALKAWRLVAARLSVVALAGAAILLSSGKLVRPDLLLFLVLGALLLIALLLVVHYLRRLIGVLNARRANPWPVPANENTMDTSDPPPGVVMG